MMNKPLPLVTECVRSMCEQREVELCSWVAGSGGHGTQQVLPAAKMPSHGTLSPARHLCHHLSRLALLAGMEFHQGIMVGGCDSLWCACPVSLPALECE